VSCNLYLHAPDRAGIGRARRVSGNRYLGYIWVDHIFQYLVSEYTQYPYIKALVAPRPRTSYRDGSAGIFALRH
jgi:hypothetical protein